MSAVVSRLFSRIITSPTRRALRRRLYGWRNRLAAYPAKVHFFHDPADPYSLLALQMLDPLARRYAVAIDCHPVPPPDAAAAPDPARLAAWSRRDAPTVAAAYGLSAMAAELPWPAGADDDAAQRIGQALRRRWGHYLGGMFYFDGEWYWGLDRLHYLENRLADLGLDRAPGAPPLAPVKDVALTGPAGAAAGKVLHFFLSFRSPYSYLALARARALARWSGAELRLRFVLPMVMRGLPVPLIKRLYILTDCKREAERLGLPFGDVADPLGRGVEQGLAVLHHALRLGKGEEFCESFMRGVFSEGIASKPMAGITVLASRAGLTAPEIAAALADPSWRATAESNRQEMLAAGLWGVPCFRIDDGPMLWGQDRLWQVEQALISES